MTDEERADLLARCDATARDLSRAYADIGVTAFMVRPEGEHDVSVIGPSIKNEDGYRLLARAAMAWRDREPLTLN